MSAPFISSYHTHRAGYISLVDFTLEDVPETVEVSGYTLVRKSEFHVSLVSLKRLAPILNKTEEELVLSFLEYQGQHDLASFQLTDTFRLVRRGEKVAVVVMVDMPDVFGLFDFLRSKYDVDFPTQPTHITLFTLEFDMGIPLFSAVEVNEDSVKVGIPILSGLRVKASS